MDATGNKVVDYTYDHPYGNTSADATVDNSFQYTGRENDGTGLYYYRARYYSPILARFISSDPIGLDGGINVYAYVDDDPISGIDPGGLIFMSTLGGLQRGVSLGQAATFGAPGNAAAVAGGAAGAVGATSIPAAEGVSAIAEAVGGWWKLAQATYKIAKEINRIIHPDLEHPPPRVPPTMMQPQRMIREGKDLRDAFREAESRACKAR
jgi:RHS repeat-associated protein